MALSGDPTRAGGGPPAAEVLAPGAAVADWRVVRHIATGGFGAVYEARHATSDVRGALKILHANLAGSPEMVARVVREAELIAGFHHPGIVELLAAGADDRGQPYLVMELLSGRDLAAVVAERGRLGRAEVEAILTPLTDALTTVHAHGIVHRDLKASNVFMVDAPRPRVVLLDFGIAKLLDTSASALTTSRAALGTPASMAPEQIRGGAIDPRTDVYALGALAYHLLTGRMPFDDVSVTISQYLHLHAARPRPSAVAPIEPRLDEVVTRAMAIEPARRHASAAELLAAFRAVAAPPAPAAPLAQTGHAVLIAAAAAGDVTAADDALLDDIDQVIPLAERLLADAGFVLARDLGDRAVFVATAATDPQAILAARRALGGLDRRPGRDPRARVALVLHRGEVLVADHELVGGELLEPDRWAPTATEPGGWATAALGGDGLRRL